MEAAACDPIPLSSWQPTVSGNATLDLSIVPAGKVSALRFDFDFKGGKGFVVARRAWAHCMPGEYALHLRLRGHGPANHIEIKLVDSSGLNVWRYVAKDHRPSSRWKRCTIESRDIEFAWGPASGSTLVELGFVEIAIVAGEGGRGSLCISDLEIEDLTPPYAPTAVASSEQPGFGAAAALGGAGWKPGSDDRRPWIAVDSGRVHSVGGLIIDWLGGAPRKGFRVRASNDGRRWKIVHRAPRAAGLRSYVYLPGLRTRCLRVDVAGPCEGAKLCMQSFEFSRSIEAFWYAVANGEPRGWHPRWLHREQSEWTPSGRSNGTQCALMNTDGMVEVAGGSFSLEPMLKVGQRLYTWADVESRPALDQHWVPVPTIHWKTGQWGLTMEAQTAQDGEVSVSYCLENRTEGPLEAVLFVVVRPFQVTPPWQSFRNVGGVSRIHELAWDGSLLRVNATLDVRPDAGARFGAMSFDDGFVAARLDSGVSSMAAETHDEFGFATGAFEFDVALEPGACQQRVLRAGPHGELRQMAAPSFDWVGQMRTDQWSGSGWAREAIEAALTATTHILITRSGPALQPGPRRYTRSWIRDGAMMSAALLRMGHAREVLEFIRWYGPFQRHDGFVPCCVDRDGPDWLVEHDSHGQLLALIADYHRFAGDREFLREVWPFVVKAVGCIEGLLESDGLLPISVSHEGYLAQPVHSYWDDFWALRGLSDAADMARTRGAGDGAGGGPRGDELAGEELARRWLELAARVGRGLFASIGATRAAHQLDFIPGSAEWADFDPTATANAIYLLDVPEALDRAAVERTFDKYLADWRSKRAPGATSQSYTPYEIRIIGALVRLGRRNEALELLRFFLSDRRPSAWNQWPEIAWRDRKAPAHVGDLPHTWISAEYVLALRSLFAYERESDRVLVVAAGLAPEWIEGDGVRVRAMPTLYGALSYSLRQIDGQTVKLDIGSGPDCRIIFKPPLAAPLREVRVNGAPVRIDGDSVAVPSFPAEVLCITSG